MPSCPRCQQAVKTQATNCPTCGLALTAHGHPGMPLHRSQGNQFLCTSCAYELDDSCTYPQRPYAQECPMYRDVNKPSQPKVGRRGGRAATRTNSPSTDPRPAWRVWLQDSPAGLVLLGLLGIAIWIAMRR